MGLQAGKYDFWYNEHLLGQTEADSQGHACYDMEIIPVQELPKTLSTLSTTTSTTLTSTTFTVTTSTSGLPTLLCFSVMTGSEEELLMKTQLKKRIGIFACDETIVMSMQKTRLGNDVNGKDVWSWVNPVPPVPKGTGVGGTSTSSFLNVFTFQRAFDIVLADSERRVWKHDWLVKVDPDAVFFANRLKLHLKGHTPDPKWGNKTFLINCNAYGGAMYGSVEVYSQEAMRAYRDGEQRCKTELAWHGWGEDLFMQSCMDKSGVARIFDYQLVGDSRCIYASCTDKRRVAFHPFKNVGAYLSCYYQSVG